jgi:hypothetical protein
MNRKRWFALGGVVALLLASLALVGSRSHSLSPVADYEGDFESNRIAFHEGPTQRWLVDTWILVTDDLKGVGELIETRFPVEDGWIRVRYSNAVGLQRMSGGSLHEVIYGQDNPGKVWVKEVRGITSVDYLREWVDRKGRVAFIPEKADRRFGE